MRRFAIVLALLLAGTARADPAGLEARLRWPPPLSALEAEPPAGLAPARVFSAPDGGETLDVPRFRLEVWGRYAALLQARVKKGPEFNAHTVEPRHDAHLPGLPLLGFRVILDVKIHPNLVFGLHYTALQVQGPTRALHDRGVAIQARGIAGNTLARTRLQVQTGELFVRWVFRDNEQVRIAVGIAGVWKAFHLWVVSHQVRVDGRIEEEFVPALSYLLSIRVAPRLTLFLESLTGLIAPLRFPSYMTEARAGIRVPLGGGIELGLAGSLTGAQFDDLQDLKRIQRTQDHRHRRASWTTFGVELGVAARF